MGIRSFLAFELPVEIKKGVSAVSEDLKKSSLDARWVKVENIHLTMVFLGHMAPEHLESIQERVGAVCQNHRPFQIIIQGLGVFGSKRHPRVLWMGLSGDVKRLAVFRDDLQDALEPFGVKTEKRVFKPHLTLGRFRKGARSTPDVDSFLSRFDTLTSPACLLQELVLFRSDLKQSGAVYTPLARMPLGS